MTWKEKLNTFQAISQDVKSCRMLHFPGFRSLTKYDARSVKINEVILQSRSSEAIIKWQTYSSHFLFFIGANFILQGKKTTWSTHATHAHTSRNKHISRIGKSDGVHFRTSRAGFTRERSDITTHRMYARWDLDNLWLVSGRQICVSALTHSR